jgi:hypothetical protein
MEGDEVCTGLRRHLRSFFAKHRDEEHRWVLGPAIDVLPRLRVVEFSPGPRSASWVYASVGAWEARSEARLEFLITAPDQDLRHVELLTMAAWYHRQRCLGLGHTFPIGEPWLPRSRCDFMLVSLPYPFGPALEVCELPDGHVHYLWLLPITRAERDFKAREGQEALEQRFDECGLEYGNPLRDSVV